MLSLLSAKFVPGTFVLFSDLQFLKLSTQAKIYSRRHSEFCFNFSRKIGFDIWCKLSYKETIYMKCQSPFPEKNNIILSFAEFVHLLQPFQR